MKSLSSKFWLFFISVLLLIATVLICQQMISKQASQGMPPAQQQTTDPDVSIIWQKAASYEGKVTAYGAVNAHYEVALTAQVSGQIKNISTQFESGYQLKKGDWLAKLENTDYVATVEQAKQTLANAEVSLLEEQRQGQQALVEWKTSGLNGQPDSELVLRHPQLKAAEATVAQAKADLNSAIKNLNYSTIKAPFDALVVTRSVSPGSFVQTGSDIATLYSTDRVEVEVALSEKDWQNLPSTKVLDSGKWSATLTSVETGTIWSGHIVRTQQHLDTDTRQRSIVIAVEQPFTQSPALYPGTFVKADITGRQIDHLWQLPSSALNQRGELWFVDANNALQKVSVTPQFSRDNQIYISVPAQFTENSVAILTHPLNSYLVGMKVTPVEESHD